MRTIKANQIKSVLGECLSRSSKDKVYSVLFVSELDDYVKSMIEEWVYEQGKKGFTYSFAPPKYLYEEHQGVRRKTDYYAYFDQANIVFNNIEFGGGEDKSKYVNAFLNLKNKEGFCHNKDIQLIIMRTLNPAWVNNRPLFGIDDSSLFDEIISIELDKEVFKEMYLGEKERLIKELEERIIKNDPSDDIEDFQSLLSKNKRDYDLAKFVLEHPDFDFVPLKRLEGEYDPSTGTATDGFSPVNFCNFFNHTNIESAFKYSTIREKYKEILSRIIDEYRTKH